MLHLKVKNITRELSAAVAWCASNLSRYLPKKVVNKIPFNKIRIEFDDGEDMYSREVGITSGWVVKVNKAVLSEFTARYGDMYDLQSVFVHEIVEQALRDYFNLQLPLPHFHLVAQKIERIQRGERRLGECPICSQDRAYNANGDTPFQLFSKMERLLWNETVRLMCRIIYV